MTVSIKSSFIWKEVMLWLQWLLRSKGQKLDLSFCFFWPRYIFFFRSFNVLFWTVNQICLLCVILCSSRDGKKLMSFDRISCIIKWDNRTNSPHIKVFVRYYAYYQWYQFFHLLYQSVSKQFSESGCTIQAGSDKIFCCLQT